MFAKRIGQYHAASPRELEKSAKKVFAEGYVAYNSQNFSKALVSFEFAKSLITDDDGDLLKGQIHYYLANTYLNIENSDPELVISNLQLAAGFFKTQLNDIDHYTLYLLCTTDLVNSCLDNDFLEEATSQLLECLQLIESTNKNLEETNIYSNLYSLAAQHLGVDSDLKIRYLEKAIFYHPSYDKKMGLAQCYIQRGSFSDALELLNDIPIEEITNTEYLAAYHYYLGECQFALNQPIAAAGHLLKAWQLYQMTEDQFENAMSTLIGLSLSCALSNNLFEKANAGTYFLQIKHFYNKIPKTNNPQDMATAKAAILHWCRIHPEHPDLTAHQDNPIILLRSLIIPSFVSSLNAVCSLKIENSNSPASFKKCR